MEEDLVGSLRSSLLACLRSFTPLTNTNQLGGARLDGLTAERRLGEMQFRQLIIEEAKGGFQKASPKCQAFDKGTHKGTYD